VAVMAVIRTIFGSLNMIGSSRLKSRSRKVSESGIPKIGTIKGFP
jgi:hypothetical protein